MGKGTQRMMFVVFLVVSRMDDVGGFSLHIWVGHPTLNGNSAV